jgi:hypothetical protein
MEKNNDETATLETLRPSTELIAVTGGASPLDWVKHPIYEAKARQARNEFKPILNEWKNSGIEVAANPLSP